MIRRSSRPAPVGAVLLDLVLPRGRRIEELSPGNLHKRELGQMSTRFVSKRQRIAPGSLLNGAWQSISALESGLVKAKLELLEKESDRLLDPFAKGLPIIAIGVLNGESDGRLKGPLEEFAIFLRCGPRIRQVPT